LNGLLLGLFGGGFFCQQDLGLTVSALGFFGGLRLGLLRFLQGGLGCLAYLNRIFRRGLRRLGLGSSRFLARVGGFLTALCLRCGIGINRMSYVASRVLSADATEALALSIPV
jgi:hypothetical protein